MFLFKGSAQKPGLDGLPMGTAPKALASVSAPLRSRWDGNQGQAVWIHVFMDIWIHLDNLTYHGCFYMLFFCCRSVAKTTTNPHIRRFLHRRLFLTWVASMLRSTWCPQPMTSSGTGDCTFYLANRILGKLVNVLKQGNKNSTSEVLKCFKWRTNIKDIPK